VSEKPGWEFPAGSIRVHGSKGALRIFHYGNKLFFCGADGPQEIELPIQPHPANFRLQMESFVGSILRNEEPEVTARDGLKALQVVLAAYESDRLGAAVQLEPL